MAKKKRGTSNFTHQDDARAPIHGSHPAHHGPAHWGEDFDEEQHRTKPIVLGPPAFGSPNRETLGHAMLPQHRSAEAEKFLDPDWKAEHLDGQEKVEDPDYEFVEDYRELSRSELLAEAKHRGLDVKDNTSKEDLVLALEANDEGIEVEVTGVEENDEVEVTAEETTA